MTGSTQLDPDDRALLLIVVGAHLRAERADRPLGYRLREQMLRRLDEDPDGMAGEVEPVVLSDLWYLNDATLRQRPAIALGDPEVNAATAYFATRLPTAFVIDRTLRVHMDPELVDLNVCAWGATTSATASAVDAFVERYLDEWLAAVGAQAGA